MRHLTETNVMKLSRDKKRSNKLLANTTLIGRFGAKVWYQKSVQSAEKKYDCDLSEIEFKILNK